MPLSNVIIVDHGGLLGLSNDDHTQYVLAAGTRALTGDWDIGDGRYIAADTIRARDGDGLKLYDDGGNGIFVEDGGSVGIGTETPESTARLQIKGNTPYLFFEESDQANKLWHIGGLNSGFQVTESGIDQRFYVQAGGNVGIGVVDPDAKLEVSGDVHLTTDSDKFLRGAAQDAGDWYDGTDWIFDAQLVGTGLIRINNAVAYPTVTKTANYTATKTDRTIRCNASGGAFTIFLPAAGTVTGIIYYIKKIDSSANIVTIDADGAETIDEDPTVDITVQGESLTLQSYGSSYDIL